MAGPAALAGASPATYTGSGGGMAPGRRIPGGAMSPYLLLGVALVLNAAANLLMKYAAVRADRAPALEGAAALARDYLSLPFLAGLACFGLNLLAYSQALKKLPLSIAYPTMVSLGYLIILVVSWFVFQERLTLPRYVGAGLILAGIWLVVR